MNGANLTSVMFLTLVGKRGSRPVAEGTLVDLPGEGHFVVNHVLQSADGSWQATAMRDRTPGDAA